MGVLNLAGALERHEYDSRDDLAEALALAVSGILAGGIATRGNAVLAVSGGSTPKKFFERLSHVPLEWSRVTVLLVDERIVPPNNERANAKLVAENLLINKAKDANFEPFVVDGASPEDCARKSSVALEQSGRQIDALVLGMGTDGHTASFFPNGDKLADALNMDGEALVLPMQAEGAGEPRLTLTLPPVLDARFIALHIEGAEKQTVLDAALGGSDASEMPIRAVLQHTKKQVQLFWAP